MRKSLLDKKIEKLLEEIIIIITITNQKVRTKKPESRENSINFRITVRERAVLTLFSFQDQR